MPAEDITAERHCGKYVFAVGSTEGGPILPFLTGLGFELLLGRFELTAQFCLKNYVLESQQHNNTVTVGQHTV